MLKPSRYNTFVTSGGHEYVYNSFSKACIKINNGEKDRIHEVLEAKDFLAGPEAKYQDILLENGLVLDSSVDEIARVEYLYCANYFESHMLNLVLVPTLKCNLACPYCFEAGHKTMETVSHYFPALKAFAEKHFEKYETVQISLFGGEPLLFSDALLDYLSFLSKLKKNKRYNLITSIVTNATLLDKKTADRLLENDCVSLQATIDGDKEMHNTLRVNSSKVPTYDTIVSNFQAVVDLGIARKKKTHFILRLNLYNQNVESVRKTLSDVDERLRSHIDVLFRPIYSTACFESKNTDNCHNLRGYYEAAEKLGYGIVQNSYFLQQCEAGGDKNFFYVTPDLKTWKCLGDMSYKAACFGEIRPDGDLLLAGDKLAAWYKHSNPFSDRKCRECAKLPECYGGCIMKRMKTGAKSCKSDDMIILPNIYATSQKH